MLVWTYAFGVAIVLTTLTVIQAQVQVDLVSSATTNNTILVGETIVLTCSVKDAVSLSWLWNGEEIISYVSTLHSMCGNRTQHRGNLAATADIHTILAALAEPDETTHDCTSIMEVKPVTTFSRVNISCVAVGEETMNGSYIIVSAQTPSVISFSSSLREGDTIPTERLTALTCRGSGRMLKWTYERNDQTETEITTHDSTDHNTCTNKTSHPHIDSVNILSLLAANDRSNSAGDITSLLEVTHERAFERVTIRCRVIGEEGTDDAVNSITFVIAALTSTPEATTTAGTTSKGGGMSSGTSILVALMMIVMASRAGILLALANHFTL